MQKILLAQLAVACWYAPGNAVSDEYPSRPIVMISPFPAGAPLDTVARIIGARMRVSLGQPIVIEDVAGAGGTLGVARAARAPADGYTLSIGNFSSHVVASAVYKTSYDVLGDFEPVALIASNPQLIVSSTAVPAHDLKNLIGWLKRNPDKASAGTAGVGSVSHLAGVLFQRETGTRFQFVPYRGVNLAEQELIGGQLDLLFDQAPSALPHVRAGKIRAYAVTAGRRLASAPDIPSADEAGLPGLHMSVWSALWARKGTSAEVIAKLNAAVLDATADPDVHTRLVALGMEITPREQQTPAALGVLHKAEIERWWPLIKAGKITAE